jgi:phage gp36-like protein
VGVSLYLLNPEALQRKVTESYKINILFLCVICTGRISLPFKKIHNFLLVQRAHDNISDAYRTMFSCLYRVQSGNHIC